MSRQNHSKTAAFFDVDYTILRNNSASLFVKFLRREGKVGPAALLHTLYYLLLYKLNLLDFERLAEKETAKFAGLAEQEMVEFCERWFREMVAGEIYPEAVELIRRHQAEGEEVVLLSAATVYLVRPLAQYLKVEHYLCNRLEVDEQKKFTGKLVRPLCYGEGKIILARRLAEELGIDLGRSFYYSDSITDLPVLECFGKPRPVNPDPLLRKQARRRKWPILDFPSRNSKRRPPPEKPTL